MTEELLTIEGVTQRCVKGHGGWKHRELLREARNRGLEVSSKASKSDLCRALKSTPGQQTLKGETLEESLEEEQDADDVVPNKEDLADLTDVSGIGSEGIPVGYGKKFSQTEPRDVFVDEERYLLWIAHFSDSLSSEGVAVVEVDLEKKQALSPRGEAHVLIFFSNGKGAERYLVLVDNTFGKVSLLLPSGEGTFGSPGEGLEATPFPFSSTIDTIGYILADVYPDYIYETSPLSRNCPDFVKIRGLQQDWNFFTLGLSLLNGNHPESSSRIENKILNAYSGMANSDLEFQLLKFRTYVDSVTPTLSTIESLGFLRGVVSARAFREIVFFSV